VSPKSSQSPPPQSFPPPTRCWCLAPRRYPSPTCLHDDGGRQHDDVGTRPRHACTTMEADSLREHLGQQIFGMFWVHKASANCRASAARNHALPSGVVPTSKVARSCVCVAMSSLSLEISLSLSLWVCLRVSQGAVMPCSRAQTKTRGNSDRGTRVPAVHSTHPAAACMLPVRFNSKPQSWCCFNSKKCRP